MISVSQDTICAVATPPGTGGVAIIRISGPDSIRVCDRVFVSGKMEQIGEIGEVGEMEEMGKPRKRL
jgi:tRNA U34 5-carboxymethylaminomethyl modifying GTPase MnmE/TrmE